MKIAIALAVLGVLLGFAREVLAEKHVAWVTPRSSLAAEGIAARVERRDDGLIEFTVTRDPAKATYHDRTATLRVNDPAGLIARCPVQATEVNQALSYQFLVAPSRAEHSEFVLSEDQGGEVIGGGTIYHVRLKDFVSQGVPDGQ